MPYSLCLLEAVGALENAEFDTWTDASSLAQGLGLHGSRIIGGTGHTAGSDVGTRHRMCGVAHGLDGTIRCATHESGDRGGRHL